MKLRLSISITAMTVLAALATRVGLAAQDTREQAKIVTIDAPGAGTSPGQGTSAFRRGRSPDSSVTGALCFTASCGARERRAIRPG